MSNIENEYSQIRKIYRDIFLKSKQALDVQLNGLSKLFLCTDCTENCKVKSFSLTLPLQKLPEKCIYRDWQRAAVYKLDNEVAKDICKKLDEIEKFRTTFQCARCASCCRLASSEFSPEQLKEKSKNGDSFAKQFLSIFVPYETYEEAYKIYPEYFELLKKTYGEEEKIYFYYCPKLGADNLCTDYENRPQVCREFPNNPLVLLPKNCGYNEWKEQVGVLSMMLHALLEVSTFYKDKLADALENKA